MAEQSFAQQLAQDAVDGLMKQATKQAGDQIQNPDGTIDPETQQKIIQREIKMASDPDFALQEEAKLTAADRMRRQREGGRVETKEKPEDTEKRRNDELFRQRAEAMENAKDLYASCINAGGSPKFCADMVANLTETRREASGPPATSITELVSALHMLDEMRGSNKGDSETKDLLKQLVDIRQKESDANIKALQASIESLAKKVAETGTGNGYKPRKPRILKADGTPLVTLEEDDVYFLPHGDEKPTVEETREKNRHDEELARIANEKEYKESIAVSVSDAAGALVTFVGEGATDIIGKRKDGAPAKKQDVVMQEFECGNCHKKFAIVPGTPRFQCPECGQPYSSIPGEWEQNQPGQRGEQPPPANPPAGVPPQEEITDD